MTRLILLALLLTTALCGCQTLNLTCAANSGENAKLSGTVKDTDTPTTTTSAQANLPLQGGTVTNPVQTTGK